MDFAAVVCMMLDACVDSVLLYYGRTLNTRESRASEGM